MPSEQRDLVLQGPIFSVERMEVTVRGGERVVRHFVRHPGAVCVLGVLDDGRLVTIRNFRIAVGAWLNEFCAGKLEPGEDPRAAALRELKEETGYDAASIESLGTFYTSPGFADEVMHAFVAHGLTLSTQKLEADERIEVVLRTVDEFRRMVRSGEVCDGKTLATFLRWQLSSDAAPAARM